MKDAKLVHEFLENSADRRPEKIALVCDGNRFTYGDIESRANRLAQALITHGVKRGDRVLFYLPNCVELVVGIFASLKAGAVFVVVNHTSKRGKFSYIMDDCQASALLTWPDRAGLAAQLLKEYPCLKLAIVTGDPTSLRTLAPELLRYGELLASSPDRRPPTRTIDLDLACIIYTSGSSGQPKGVMSGHSSMIFAVDSVTTYLQNAEDDVVICVSPLSFSYGLYQPLMVFSFGGRLVLEKGFNYPDTVLANMQQEQVTGFPGVPTHYSRLLTMDLSRYDLSSLRYMTSAAAILPSVHIHRIREKFPGVRFYSMYGQTETKRTLYLPPEELNRRPESVGIAIPGTEVWIEDDEGKRLGPGEIGELVVRGRHVMRGYWRDPVATALRFRRGRLPGERICYTGDLFRMDAEGFFYFVARKDDIIKCCGEKVSPKEIESVLYKLESVREAAVIGIPDPVMGQVIKAFIVANGSGLTEARTKRHCRVYLEDIMVPKVIEFCGELPKTASGKIKKMDLK